MFRKLRIKFIAITMVMVAVVMALAFSAVCIIEYQRSSSVVETTLHDAINQAASDEAFRFGQGDFHRREVAGQFGLGPSGGQDATSASQSALATDSTQSSVATDSSQSASDASQSSTTLESDAQGAAKVENTANAQDAAGTQAGDSQGWQGGQGRFPDDEWAGYSEGIAPPVIGNRRNEQKAQNSLIPVAVYALGSDGTPTLVPQVTNASISEEVLAEAVEGMTDASEGFGAIADLGLHYVKASSGDSVYLAFADTSYTDGWKTLALMLAVVALVTLVVFFIVSLFYSNWALRPVREAWDSQRQFVADASHDLKTPITVILANAAILLKHPERSIASESQWVESTQVEAENMQGLVNEMLELAQIEAGEKVEIEKAPIDFSDLVDGETLLFDSVALERNCSFECDIEENLHVMGNEKQVKKMVATLVENAFKYVDENGAVGIVLKRAGKGAVLSISNTGSVIAPDDLPHIFDRFYRTDKARTSGAGGFGLGLAIAREVALQHGGDITCTSDSATGTVFTVTLPLL